MHGLSYDYYGHIGDLLRDGHRRSESRYAMYVCQGSAAREGAQSWQASPLSPTLLLRKSPCIASTRSVISFSSVFSTWKVADYTTIVIIIL